MHTYTNTFIHTHENSFSSSKCVHNLFYGYKNVRSERTKKEDWQY